MLTDTLPEAGGTFRGFDVSTDGVSMLNNYRSQLNRIIAKDGVPGLITKMKKKLASGTTATP